MVALVWATDRGPGDGNDGDMGARLPALETALPEIADRLYKPAAQSEQFAAREDVAALRGERLKTIDDPTGKLSPSPTSRSVQRWRRRCTASPGALTGRQQPPSPGQA
ncbi:hypothetical protein ACQUJT_09870 [Ralstonia pseudosolanacearum]